ncbi:MAG: DUF4199 domain-containing protein [Bacteroidia bacterium]
MEDEENDLTLSRQEANKIIFTYGVTGAVTYIVYFLIMWAAGLIGHTELRYVNYALCGIVGFMAMQKVKQQEGGHVTYLQGLGIAFLTGVVSFIVLGLFVYIFAKLNPGFLTAVLKDTPMAFASFTDPAITAASLIVSEGVAFSVIIALCLMQYFKSP